MSNHILVAYDGSSLAEKALTFARSEWPDVETTLCYVINPAEAGDGFGAGVPSAGEEWFEEAKAVARERLDDAVDAHGEDLRTRIEVGRPAKTILEVAREEAETGPAFDHLVIGSHGRKGVSRILLGSVAEAIVRDSPVPVTVVR